MKNIKRSLFLSIFISFIFVTNVESFSITRNLKIGMVGEDIRVLQKMLNQDNDTMVAKTGIGSPGQESTYFGLLTHKAVIRFQEKNRDIILKPNGLTSGTGFVGQSTRNFLAKLSIPNTNSQNVLVSTTTSTKSVEINQKDFSLTQNVKISSNVVGSGPNYENISTFIDSIDRVAKQKGLSEEKIVLIKEEIYKGVATTTDLKGEFMKMVQDKNRVSSKINKDSSLFAIQWERLFNKAKSTLIPKKVSAATGIPFGGALIFAFPCNCSNTWLLTLTPLPPTGVVLLDYIQGSQAFLSYNIPFTNWLLGEYIIGANTCFTGYMCTGIPAEGLITPTVGSSLE